MHEGGRTQETGEDPRILNERYRVDELIGRGGMADVFRGLDLRLNRTVAVKLMRPDLARDTQFQARFRQEARSAASLNHPAIVAVFDTGETPMSDAGLPPVDCPFLVLEHVRGKTLRELLHEGPVTWHQAVDWTRGLLEALAHSHQRGIVHRDVKPANVMLTHTGEVKVMDFGIARALADTSASTSQAQTVVGTALYLSPEQATGREVDARSDLYSAGCVLFELLTGQAPFTGDTPLAVAYQHVRQPAPAPSDVDPEVPRAFDAVVLRALAKDPAERFASATEFLHALEAAAADPHAVPEPEPETRSLPTVAPAATGDADDAAAADAHPEAGHAVASSSLPGAASPAQLAAAASVEGHAPSTGSRPIVAAAALPVRTEPAPGADVAGSETPGPRADSPADRDRPAGRRRVLVLLGAALAALLVVVGGVLLALRAADAGSVDLPALQGTTEAEAMDALDDLGLRGTVVSAYSEDVDQGRVVGTDPPAGTRVERGSEVRLRVSRGPADVVIPHSLRGATEAAVRQELDRLGLSVSSVEYQDAGSLARGSLVRTDPPLGTGVAAGTPVVLYLSSGMVRVPDVHGMTAADARTTLRAVAPDLVVRFQSADGQAAEDGVVVSQEPASGTRVDNHSAITLLTSGSAPATAEASLPAAADEVPAAPAAPTTAGGSASAAPSSSADPEPSASTDEPTPSAEPSPSDPAPSSSAPPEPSPTPAPTSSAPTPTGEPSGSPSVDPTPSPSGGSPEPTLVPSSGAPTTTPEPTPSIEPPPST